LPTEIYILSCNHISLKINVPLIQTTRLPVENQQQHPAGGAPHSLLPSVLSGIPFSIEECIIVYWFSGTPSHPKSCAPLNVLCFADSLDTVFKERDI